MSSSINATLGISLSCQKQETTTDPTASSPTLSLNLQPINPAAFAQLWNAATTPDGEEAWTGQITLSAGVATIDLTSLTQIGLSTAVNATGLKVRAICLLPDAANANPIQIGTGASNGYTGIGVISALNAGNVLARTCAGAAAIDGTHKTLDLAGTGSQKLNILIVFGN